jgi:hypothetical protein
VVLYIVLAVTLLGGLSGYLGVKTAVAEAEAGGLHLEVEYDQVSRSGLPVALIVRVSTIDGEPLPERLGLAITASYLPQFDEHGLSPDPESSWSNGDERVLEFVPPPNEPRLEVVFDGRMEPGLRWGSRARITVLIDGGPVVGVNFRTWVMP